MIFFYDFFLYYISDGGGDIMHGHDNGAWSGDITSFLWGGIPSNDHQTVDPYNFNVSSHWKRKENASYASESVVFLARHRKNACAIGVRAGTTGGMVRYIYIETHRSGKWSVNHKGNCSIYTYKHTLLCKYFAWKHLIWNIFLIPKLTGWHPRLILL